MCELVIEYCFTTSWKSFTLISSIKWGFLTAVSGTNSDNLGIQSGDKGEIAFLKMLQYGKRNYQILISKATWHLCWILNRLVELCKREKKGLTFKMRSALGKAKVKAEAWLSAKDFQSSWKSLSIRNWQLRSSVIVRSLMFFWRPKSKSPRIELY